MKDYNLQESINAVDLVSDAYTILSKYIAKTRVYPSIYDGMKSVYRRILYANRDSTKLVKASSFVGEAIKLHPHGDSSISGALVNLACKYSKFPLLLGKGNWGGMGFESSGIRYLECKIHDISKFLYLDLVDYAEYEYGESGYEPKYLPSMLPYAFLEGSSGIGTGLPNPSIPPLNPIMLVDYCISLLSNKDPVIPLPDFGDIIIDMTKSQIDKVLSSGEGKLYLKSYLIRESVNTVVVKDLPPQVNIDTIIQKLQSYVDSDKISITNESSSDYRYVFTINDLGIYDEFYKKLESLTKKTFSVSYLFEMDGQVVSCGLEYAIRKSLDLYKSSYISKITDLLEKYSTKLKLVNCIKYLKDNDYINKILDESVDIKSLLLSQGYSIDIYDKVMSRSVKSLLSSEVDSEINDLTKEITKLQYDLDNIDNYLIDKYVNLRNYLESTFLLGRKSSILQSDLDSRKEVKAFISNDQFSIDLLSSKRKGLSFSNIIYYLYDINKIGYFHVLDKYREDIINIDYKIDHLISDKYKYKVIVYGDNHVYINYTKDLSKSVEKFRLIDGYEHTKVYQFDKSSVVVVQDDNSELVVNLEDYIPKRFSYPHKITSSRRTIVSVKEII